ncbi:MAG: hypothetical protein QXT30_07565 [Candidatus Bathyarchaeia archaeon]
MAESKGRDVVVVERSVLERIFSMLEEVERRQAEVEVMINEIKTSLGK